MKKPTKAQQEEDEVRARFKWAEEGARLRGAAKELLERVSLLFQMLCDPGYEPSWAARVLIVTALTYFVCPVDLIPDPLPGGYADDAIIVALVLSQLGDEVAKYRRWKGAS